MNKKKLDFWIKCPNCGNRFGVPLDVVMKYLDRVKDEMRGMIKKCKGKLEEKKHKAPTEESK